MYYYMYSYDQKEVSNHMTLLRMGIRNIRHDMKNRLSGILAAMQNEGKQTAN